MNKLRHGAILAFLLVMLVEVLWVGLDTERASKPVVWQWVATKVSVGFPVNCVSVTTLESRGKPLFVIGTDDPWAPGVRFLWGWCLVDLLAAVAVFLGMTRLLRHESGRLFIKAAVLGVVGGVLMSLGSSETGERNWLTWVSLAFLFAGLPALICFHTKRLAAEWGALSVLAVSLMVLPWASQWGDQFKTENRFTISHRSKTALAPTVQQMVVQPLACWVVLSIPLFVMRRVQRARA